eukprot:SAG25_NODE_11235_length_310_cov_0.725118_1_plen_22_part_01
MEEAEPADIDKRPESSGADTGG